MNKSILKWIILSLLLCSNAVWAQSADDIVGEWYNTEKDAKIDIFKEGDKYFGKIVWLQDPMDNGKPKVDQNNSDKSKRDRPILGIRILNDFVYNNGVWENGTVYDPKNGKTYSCIIRKKADRTLEVRGYVGISLIGRTVVWTRVN